VEFAISFLLFFAVRVRLHEIRVLMEWSCECVGSGPMRFDEL
jgi:hypothetical protein